MRSNKKKDVASNLLIPENKNVYNKNAANNNPDHYNNNNNNKNKNNKNYNNYFNTYNKIFGNVLMSDEDKISAGKGKGANVLKDVNEEEEKKEIRKLYQSNEFYEILVKMIDKSFKFGMSKFDTPFTPQKNNKNGGEEKIPMAKLVLIIRKLVSPSDAALLQSFINDEDVKIFSAYVFNNSKKIIIN